MKHDFYVLYVAYDQDTIQRKQLIKTFYRYQPNNMTKVGFIYQGALLQEKRH